jgi:acetate kinase
VRAAAAERLGWLGVALDSNANEAAHDDADITAPTSAVRCLVVTAREDLQIVREARALLDV